ncbi:MAG TPA: dihydroorotate dehydrogenase [Syntrophales bacterium]|nr:dihydroorotate dehydrogenase [Syntrophales bacterium]
MANTAVSIGRLRLANPVMTASGTFGYGEEYAGFVDLNRLGAVVVKGLSLDPRPGNPPPRIVETPAGMLNAIGLQNVGVRAFIGEKLPYLREFAVPVIVNIFGERVEEYESLAGILSETDGVHGLEINVSCPNVKCGGLAFGTSPETVGEVTRRVRRVTDLPVIVKLSPNVTDIAVMAGAAEEAGADAVSLINTITGMSVDIDRRIPHLRNVTGGLSGPAVRPVALRMVWQVVKRVGIPVIGLGGIATARDALEFLIVGAKAVQVGTASFANPRATLDVVEGIERHLAERGIGDVNEIIGTLREGGEL